MRKTFVSFLVTIAVVFFVIKNFNLKSSKTTGPSIDKLELNKEEEVKARIEQEVLMTKDPALGYVPTERLIAAERVAARLNQSARGQNTYGLTWSERGPNNLGGRSRAILIDKTDGTGNTVFIGSVGGGLWRTTNFLAANPTWAQIASVSQNLAITTLAQDPNTPATMYAGTGEGYNNFDAIRGLGIYRSTDGGLTWNLLASTTTGGANVSDFGYVQKILVYTNGDVYASGISAKFCNSGGILKSTNGGTSWTRVIGTYTGCGNCSCATNFLGYDLEKSFSGDIYASTIDGATGHGHIWKSSAGATVGNAGTWADVTPTGTFQRIQLACSPITNNTVYALMQGSGNAIGGIRVTTNAGTSWTNIDNTTLWCDQGSATSTDFSRGQAWYDLTIAIKPDDDQTVFVGGVDLMKTTNGGTSWSQNTQWASGCTSLPTIHADNHNIVYLPGSATQFIVVNDGGVYYSGDGGNTYTNKSAGYRTIQYYGAALNPASGSNYMLAGAQDNGTHIFSSSGLGSVTTATGGDGGFCFIDQSNSSNQITSFTTADYVISRNGGTNFNISAYFGGTGLGRFINPTDYDNTQKIIYAGYDSSDLLRITNIASGTPAKAIINFPSAGAQVSAVKVDPNTANRVWVAFSGSGVPQIYYVDNANGGSPTVNQVTAPSISGGYISSMDIEQGNANHLIMTVSNYGVSSVWETTNLGAAWTSLDNNGVNLPDVPVRWAIFLPTGYTFTGRTESVGGIMLATELGVWTTTASNGGSTTWTQSSGLPNVRVDMVVLRNSDKTVVAATHGRGLFTTVLTSALPVTLLNFDGVLNKNEALLSWSTSAEQNSRDFDIEKSDEGMNFYKIGSVAAAGNSNTQKDYSFSDMQLSSVNYYRLRMNDRDGRNKLSQVVVIRYNDAAQTIWVVNNPFHSFIDLRFAKPGSQVRLQLINGTGATISEKIIANPSGQIRWNLQDNLSAGTYVIRAIVDGQAFISKVVKQ